MMSFAVAGPLLGVWEMRLSFWCITSFIGTDSQRIQNVFLQNNFYQHLAYLLTISGVVADGEAVEEEWKSRMWSMAEIAELAEEGSRLPVDKDLMQELQNVFEEGQLWEKQAEVMLNTTNGEQA